MSLSLFAQSPWSWGASIDGGRSGQPIDQQETFGPPGTRLGNSGTRSQAALSFRAGLWVNYRLGRLWSLQFAPQYQRLHTTVRTDNFRYNPSGGLTSVRNTTEYLHQQSISLPLRLRFYTHGPLRQWRPFLSIQAGPAYLLSGDLLVLNKYTNLTIGERTSLAQRYELDFTEDYVTARPWQLTYGAAIGVARGRFALSLTHNRSAQGSQEDIDPIIICDFGTQPCPGPNRYRQTRILRNTHVQLQYQF